MSYTIATRPLDRDETRHQFPALRCGACWDIVRDDLAGESLDDLAASGAAHDAVCRNRPTVAVTPTACPHCGRDVDPAVGCPNHPPIRHLEQAS
jgi:hypothetical protein